MRLCLSRITASAFLSAMFLTGAIAAEHALLIDDFSVAADTRDMPPGWNELHFPKIKRHTVYALEKDNGNGFVKAMADSSASAIYKKTDIDLREYPVLSWRWKVGGTLKKGDEARKEGDDYSARIYVMFDYRPERLGLFERIKYSIIEALYGQRPPENAINYIWANRLKKGTALPNAYTEKVVMVAVESGDGLAGVWVKEERNVYEDYKAHFNEDPPKATGIAIMTDSDDTKEEAVGYYDDIVFMKRAQ
jgi:hypothetical protein